MPISTWDCPFCKHQENSGYLAYCASCGMPRGSQQMQPISDPGESETSTFNPPANDFPSESQEETVETTEQEPATLNLNPVLQSENMSFSEPDDLADNQKEPDESQSNPDLPSRPRWSTPASHEETAFETDRQSYQEKLETISSPTNQEINSNPTFPPAPTVVGHSAFSEETPIDNHPIAETDLSAQKYISKLSDFTNEYNASAAQAMPFTQKEARSFEPAFGIANAPVNQETNPDIFRNAAEINETLVATGSVPNVIESEPNIIADQTASAVHASFVEDTRIKNRPVAPIVDSPVSNWTSDEGYSNPSFSSNSSHSNLDLFSERLSSDLPNGGNDQSDASTTQSTPSIEKESPSHQQTFGITDATVNQEINPSNLNNAVEINETLVAPGAVSNETESSPAIEPTAPNFTWQYFDSRLTSNTSPSESDVTSNQKASADESIIDNETPAAQTIPFIEEDDRFSQPTFGMANAPVNQESNPDIFRNAVEINETLVTPSAVSNETESSPAIEPTAPNFTWQYFDSRLISNTSPSESDVTSNQKASADESIIDNETPATQTIPFIEEDDRFYQPTFGMTNAPVNQESNPDIFRNAVEITDTDNISSVNVNVSTQNSPLPERTQVENDHPADNASSNVISNPVTNQEPNKPGYFKEASPNILSNSTLDELSKFIEASTKSPAPPINSEPGSGVTAPTDNLNFDISAKPVIPSNSTDHHVENENLQPNLKIPNPMDPNNRAIPGINSGEESGATNSFHLDSFFQNPTAPLHQPNELSLNDAGQFLSSPTIIEPRPSYVPKPASTTYHRQIPKGMIVFLLAALILTLGYFIVNIVFPGFKDSLLGKIPNPLKATITCTVTGHEWSRSGTIVTGKSTQGEGWSLPPGAQIIRTVKVTEYHKVLDHYEMKEVTTKKVVGNVKIFKGRRLTEDGEYEDIYETRPAYANQTQLVKVPVYKNQPVYKTKYVYTSQNIQKSHFSLSGKDKNAIWPMMGAHSSRVDVVESYFIRLKDKKDQEYLVSATYDAWQNINRGDSIRIQKTENQWQIVQ